VSRIPDVAIVGAGIVGAACARSLAHEGLRVVVFESGFPGGGSTAAGMGHLLVMDDSEAEFALTSYSSRLWADLVERLPDSCEHHTCGTLWVASDEEEAALIPDKVRFYRERGLAAEQLTPRELQVAEPELRRGLTGGLLISGDSVLYPPAAANWLLERAVARGTEVRTGQEVDAIGPGWLQCGGERFEAGLVVNAAGLGASRLTPELPIEPRKGHLAITDRYPGFVRHQILELGYLKSAHTMTTESVAFNVQPRPTGQLLIGSSRELVGPDPSINRRLLAQMLERAASYIPRLPQLSTLRVWTGFRPAVADKLPIIGPWPPTPGLWLAAGHEGIGIATSLGTAALLSDRILNRQPAIDPAPFDPARFDRGSLLS